MTQHTIRHYVVLKPNDEVMSQYFDPKDEYADHWATRYVAKWVYRGEVTHPPFRTAARPSNDVYFGSERPKQRAPQEAVVALDVFGDDKQQSSDTIQHIIKEVAKRQEIFAGSSTDIPFAASDHWCSEGADPVFANRSRAERLLGIDYLRKQGKTDGKGVNVVVVDEGLDKLALGASYASGWTVGSAHPGSPPPHPAGRSHGMMIAHNILKVAPEAKLYDLPLAPPRISNIQAFLSLADAAYRAVLWDILVTQIASGPWIFVNPWGIFDRKSEYPRGHYTENPNNPFNMLVAFAVRNNIDVIFAAGNCGQFCPDHRCGATDQGPGHSIWGANSLEQVLTVGAVRADNIWLGYSSQGPGQPKLGPNKPDLCAASQFSEDDDAFSINTGTSAACGLTGGIVAALRSRWDSATVPPGDLKKVLNQTARKPSSQQWNNSLEHRLGNGVLDVRAAFNALP